MKFKLTLILLSSLSFIVHFGYSMEGAWPLYQRIREGRSKFTTSEDACLIGLVKEYGTNAWKMIAECMPRRTARQCRDRWSNYLDPCLTSLKTNDRGETYQIEAMIYRSGQDGSMPLVIRNEIYATYGKLVSLVEINRTLSKAKREGWHQKMAIIHRMEAPAARDPLPPPQAQPPVLASQPGDQLITDYQQWDQMDEQGDDDEQVTWDDSPPSSTSENP